MDPRLERRIVRGDREGVRLLVGQKRYGATYAPRLARLWGPLGPFRRFGEDFPPRSVSIFVPDPFGRPDGVELVASTTGKLDHSYTDPSVMVRLGREIPDRQSFEHGEHSIEFTATLRPGLHPYIYYMSKPEAAESFGFKRWVIWPDLDPETFDLGASIALDALAEGTIRASDDLDRVFVRIGGGPGMDPVEAWPLALRWLGHSRAGLDYAGWSSERDVMFAVRPPKPAEGRTWPLNGSGFAAALAAIQDLLSVVKGWPDAVVSDEPWRRHYAGNPFSRESVAYGRAEFDLTSTRARNTQHELRVVAKFPVIMGGDPKEHPAITPEGEFDLSLHTSMPRTVQDLHGRVRREIRRLFPDAGIKLIDDRPGVHRESHFIQPASRRGVTP